MFNVVGIKEVPHRSHSISIIGGGFSRSVGENWASSYEDHKITLQNDKL